MWGVTKEFAIEVNTAFYLISKVISEFFPVFTSAFNPDVFGSLNFSGTFTDLVLP